MDNLPFSSGWVYLIGGLAGIVTVSISKRFSWKNYEFLKSENDREEEIPMTSSRRLTLIGICVLIAVYGFTQVERDHGWDAFTGKATQRHASER